MIQAPQFNYTPNFQVPPGYQQTGYIPVQAQSMPAMPGAVYNYPAASSYLPQDTKYNGVNIGIKNPQGQGQQPNYGNYYGAYMPPVQQGASGRGQFNGVNIEIMNPQGQGMPDGMMYGMPQNVMPAQFYLPPAPIQQAMPVCMPQNAAQPALPEAVPPVPPESKQPEVPAPNIQPQNEQPAPVIDAPQNPAETFDSEAYAAPFAARLNTDDAEVQKTAMEEIAEKVKTADKEGRALVDSEIFDALSGIIQKDTSALPSSPPEVIELRKKNPAQMTAEELRTASQLSEQEKAELNKRYALYTTAFLQDRLNTELKNSKNSISALKDLPCIELVVKTAKENPNPVIREAAIVSLAHIARPEYNEDLSKVFEIAQTDADERVQSAAANALSSLNSDSAVQKA